MCHVRNPASFHDLSSLFNSDCDDDDDDDDDNDDDDDGDDGSMRYLVRHSEPAKQWKNSQNSVPSFESSGVQLMSR